MWTFIKVSNTVEGHRGLNLGLDTNNLFRQSSIFLFLSHTYRHTYTRSYIKIPTSILLTDATSLFFYPRLFSFPPFYLLFTSILKSPFILLFIRWKDFFLNFWTKPPCINDQVDNVTGDYKTSNPMKDSDRKWLRLYKGTVTFGNL